MIDNRQHIIGKLIPFNFKQITIDDTTGGKGLTSSILKATPPPKKAIITVESAQLVYTIDGTTVTSSVGHIANPFDAIILEGFSQLNNFKAIRKGTTSAKISITFLR